MSIALRKTGLEACEPDFQPRFYFRNITLGTSKNWCHCGRGAHRSEPGAVATGFFIALNIDYVAFIGLPEASLLSNDRLQPPATAGGTDSDADFSEFLKILFGSHDPKLYRQRDLKNVIFRNNHHYELRFNAESRFLEDL